MGYRKGRKLLFAGNVHAGLTPRLRRDLFRQIEGLRQEKCPFANLPEERRDHWGEGVTAEDMDHFVWVKSTVNVRVGFREWTSWKRLRHPTLHLG